MLRTLTLAHSWAVTQNFISRVIAFVFSPDGEDIGGHFVDLVRYESTKPNIQETWVTQYTVEHRLFTLMMAWLVGSGDLLPQPSIAREYRTICRLPGKR